MTEPRMDRRSNRPALDEAVLRRVGERRPDAMEAFFDHFYDRVYGYVAHLVQDRTLAEDLTQETFVRIHRAIDRLDPERDPASWVFTVAVNTVRDHWRSRQHRAAARQVQMDETGAEHLANGKLGADHLLIEESTARSIQIALRQLSVEDREVILLRNYEEMTTAAIAEMLDLSQDAVRQRHSRAVARLGQAYRKCTDEERG